MTTIKTIQSGLIGTKLIRKHEFLGSNYGMKQCIHCLVMMPKPEQDGHCIERFEGGGRDYIIFENLDGEFKGRFGYRLEDSALAMNNLASKKDALDALMSAAATPVFYTEFEEPWYGCNLEDRSVWTFYPIKGQPTPKWAVWPTLKPLLIYEA